MTHWPKAGAFNDVIENQAQTNYICIFFFFNVQITLNSLSSIDQDYANITESNPEYYWLCRNISNPEFDTNGNLSAIPLVTVPEVATGYMEVQCNLIDYIKGHLF